MTRVLIADDHDVVRRGLKQLVGDELGEVKVGEAGTSQEAIGLLMKQSWDVVLLDINMPGRSGLDVLEEAKRLRPGTPVLVLSVRGEEEDKVRALDLGADDYVTKPFSLRELLARVRNQLRRTLAAAPEVLRFPDLVIDRGRRTVVQGEREVRLTPTELAILELLASRPGRPVTLRQIIAAVWTGAPATTSDTVRVHVGSLRRKLEPDPASPRYIGTEPWVGYRFLADPVEG